MAQAGQQAAQSLDDSFSIPQRLAIIVLVLAVSFGLGNLAARWLQMPDYGNKIGLVLTTLLAGI